MMRRIIIARETKLSGISFAAQFGPRDDSADLLAAWYALWFWWML